MKALIVSQLSGVDWKPGRSYLDQKVLHANLPSQKNINLIHRVGNVKKDNFEFQRQGLFRSSPHWGSPPPSPWPLSTSSPSALMSTLISFTTPPPPFYRTTWSSQTLILGAIFSKAIKIVRCNRPLRQKSNDWSMLINLKHQQNRTIHRCIRNDYLQLKCEPFSLPHVHRLIYQAL